MIQANAGEAAHWKVGIIGAGPGGLGLAIRLVQSEQPRLRSLRGVRRRRRHVALEHLPRRRLRRAVTPLLVFLRPQARLDQDVRQPARDPPVLRGVHGPLRHPAPPAAPHPDHVGDVGRSGVLLAPRRRRRRSVLLRRAGQCHRHLHHAVVPRYRGPRRLRRAELPLGALGARARPCGQAGGGHRHGRRARRRSSRRWPRSPSGSTSTSGRRSGSCPARTNRSAKRRSSASPATSGRPRSTATRSTGPSRRRSPSATRTAPPTG